MTDALDDLAPVGLDLLRRVDTTLATAGADAGDPVWSLVRRLRALPSDAMTTVVGWRPEPLRDTAATLRGLARRCADSVDPVPGAPPWEGAGADAYAQRWTSLRAYVSGEDGAAGRLADTARYADDLADWVGRCRGSLATTLVEVLGSAEAVTLVVGGPEPATGRAAARIGARVLEVLVDAVDEGQWRYDQWHGQLGEVPYRAPVADTAARPGDALRIFG